MPQCIGNADTYMYLKTKAYRVATHKHIRKNDGKWWNATEFYPTARDILPWQDARKLYIKAAKRQRKHTQAHIYMHKYLHTRVQTSKSKQKNWKQQQQQHKTCIWSMDSEISHLTRHLKCTTYKWLMYFESLSRTLPLCPVSCFFFFLFVFTHCVLISMCS